MARTRSKPAQPTAKDSIPEPLTSTAKSLPGSISNPPKLFVLPKNTSKDARIVTLDNPANGAPSRYYFCPTKGFYEFTRIAAPKKDCKSWLITSTKKEENTDEKQDDTRIGSGYITKSADLFLATPIDLLFLVLPALAPKNTKDTKQHFLQVDDYLDKLSSSSPQWRSLLSQFPSLRTMLEKRMRKICDTVDAGDETMYRLSTDKLLAVLLQKAENMVSAGLPPSLEDRFIKTALDIPIMNIKREDSSLSTPSTDTPSTQEDTTTTTTSAPDSQSTSQTTSDETAPSPPTTATLQTPPEVPHLLRLRTSLTYLSSSYLSQSLRPIVTSHLSTCPTFTPLTTHLSAIAALKSEALALRSISDNISRKRAIQEDDDKVAEREEKKRRKEEEEKKKKSEGRGVKALKKVDTSGMKKMSAFFMKAPKKV